jgi:phosphocarrier protein
MISEKVIISNHNGLHIKPAGALSNIALKYNCRVYLKVRTYNVNAKSVLGVLSAQVRQNEEVEIVCDGTDEEECLKAIVSAASEKFFVE